MKSNSGSYSFVFFSLLASCCTVGPKYAVPDLEVPCEWHSAPKDMQTAPIACFQWWKSLDDPLLTSLIERAAQQNLDLHIAATRILEARTATLAKQGDRLPHIDASMNYDHVYYSKDALTKGLLGTACPLKRHVKRNVDFFEIGFDADWEIDLFGMTAHESQAAKAEEEASEEIYNDSWVRLSAEVARNYIELRGLQQRLVLINDAIEAQNSAVALTQELVKRELVDEINLSEAQAAESSLAAEKPLIELGISKAIYRLSILLGYSPGDLFCELNNAGCLPNFPAEMAIGMPSELLRRRPDIRRAERQLAAATERVGSAIAALYPRFSLRGFIGDISTHAGSIFNPASATWIAGPQLLIPIFNSKLLLQDVELNKISTKRALLEYQKTVLEALEEAEIAIATTHSAAEQSQHIEEALQAKQRVLELTMQLSDRGVKDALDVLAAKRAVLATNETYIQSQTNLLLAYIALYKSLGGAWLQECDCAESSGN